MCVCVQGFGYGVAVQNVDVPLYAPLGEVSWGGAASTNWWASPETGTVIVGLTQVAPYSNLVADGVKPFAYAALQVGREGRQRGKGGGLRS